MSWDAESLIKYINELIRTNKHLTYLCNRIDNEVDEKLFGDALLAHPEQRLSPAKKHDNFHAGRLIARRNVFSGSN